MNVANNSTCLFLSIKKKKKKKKTCLYICTISKVENTLLNFSLRIMTSYSQNQFIIFIITASENYLNIKKKQKLRSKCM